MTRVLVTGASGYTGMRLVQALTGAGHSVRALARTPAQADALRAMGARVMIGDLALPATIAGIAANIEVIYHLAGTLNGGEISMRRVMVEGTANLIRQCLLAGLGAGGPLRACIYAGNAAVYGDCRAVQLTEDTPCRPASPLGSIALEAEGLFRAARAAHGMPAVILRLSAIYGPGRLSSTLLREGTLRIVGSGRNISSRIHVDDLVTVLLALESGAPSDLYCVADEEPSPVNDYYQTLADALGVAAPRHIPLWSASARAALRDAVHLRHGSLAATRASLLGLATAEQRLDSSRLRRDLGVHLRYSSYREGLRAALAAETDPGSPVVSAISLREPEAQY